MPDSPSPSAQLRALDEEMTEGPWLSICLKDIRSEIVQTPKLYRLTSAERTHNTRAVCILRNALPAIADLVEAAEKAIAAHAPYQDGKYIHGAIQRLQARVASLAAALTPEEDGRA